MFKANKNRIKTIHSERMTALKEASSEIEIPSIRWHIPDTGFYACIEFLNNLNIDWLIKECNKKDIHIKDMSENYLKDYFSNDILKISIGNSKVRNIKNGITSILKIISSSF